MHQCSNVLNPPPLLVGKLLCLRQGNLSTLDPRVVQPHKAPRQAIRHNIRRSGRYVPKPDLLPRYVAPYDLQFRQSTPAAFSGQSPSSHHAYAAPVAARTQSHVSHTSTMLSINNGQPTFIGRDFVPHHQLWPNWILALLCVVQYISCWVCIGYHATNYTEDSRLEVGLSLGFFIGGNVVLTGIVNTALFWYRWSKAPPRIRAKAAEQNHEAWICTRVALTLIGLAPIARYLEIAAIARRLHYLKLGHLDDTVVENSPHLKASAVGSKYSYNSRSTSDLKVDGETAAALPERIQKLRNLRRYYIRCDFDAAAVTLADAVLGAGPFAVTQGALFMRRVMMDHLMPKSTAVSILSCFIFSVLWIASAACQFYPELHYFTESELQSGKYKVSMCGRVLLFCARFVHISIRLITFVFFVSLFKYIIFAVLGLHCGIYFISLLIYRGTGAVLKAGYRPDPKLPTPLDERLKTKGVFKHLFSDLMYTYASVFEFFNGGAGKTRIRSIVYYFAYYLENAGMIGAWYSKFPFTASWYYLPLLLVVVTVQWAGGIFLQSYFFYFSSSPRGTSLCGLCCPEELRSNSARARYRLALADEHLRSKMQTNIEPVTGPPRDPSLLVASPMRLPLDYTSQVNVPKAASLYASAATRHTSSAVGGSRMSDATSGGNPMRPSTAHSKHSAPVRASSDSFTAVTDIPPGQLSSEPLPRTRGRRRPDRSRRLEPINDEDYRAVEGTAAPSRATNHDPRGDRKWIDYIPSYNGYDVRGEGLSSEEDLRGWDSEDV
ncbi:hypothetical protein AAHC03_027030 [Spirometra sp. Aus1]